MFVVKSHPRITEMGLYSTNAPTAPPLSLRPLRLRGSNKDAIPWDQAKVE